MDNKIRYIHIDIDLLLEHKLDIYQDIYLCIHNYHYQGQFHANIH